MKYEIIICFIFFLPFQLSSQNNYTLSGHVSNQKSGEALIGATLIDSISLKGSTTNEYGFYSLTLPEGNVELYVSYVGFKKQAFEFNLTEDTTLNIALKPGIAMDEVVITENRHRDFLRSPVTGMMTLQPEAIERLPVILGESDLIKTIQLLPGVQGGHEGFSGMHVRGGNNDQNLILLDGVPVYNLNHFFGMFSVFNPSVIKDVKLYKGSFPARYHGRTSSVLDIRSKEGNMQEIKGEGSVGLVASKISVEGPIKSDTASFILSARRTYIDILMKPFINRAIGDGTAGYYFYDLNGKVNYRFSEKSRLYLAGYFGKDRFYERMNQEGEQNHTMSTDRDMGWGNQTGSLRWNYVFNDRLFANTTLYYSRFDFSTGMDSDETIGDSTRHVEYEYMSGVEDLALDVDMNYMPSPAHNIRWGVKAVHHRFFPGIQVGANTNYSQVEVDTTYGADRITGLEMALYAEDNWDIGEKLSANLGINLNGYQTGDKKYWYAEPRLSLSYLLNPTTSIKASWNMTHQYLHLLTNSSVGLPTDLWVPVTEQTPPVESRQFALSGHYARGGYQVTLETYYKEMSGLIAYREGTNFYTDTESWQESVTTGRGTSYGVELMIQKKQGPVTGWISYALSKHERQFDEINFGETFPYKYDRRHVLNITAGYAFNEKTRLQATWIYQTGRTGTMPTQRYHVEYLSYYWKNSVHNYKEKNNIRFPAYHRLDIGLNMKKDKKWGERIWKVGLYNAYSRINPFYLSRTIDGKMRKVGVFPILPYVTYSFKF